MSLKRSHSGGKSSRGQRRRCAGAKVDRQELFDELEACWPGANDSFTFVDVALAIGAGEPQVSKCPARARGRGLPGEGRRLAREGCASLMSDMWPGRVPPEGVRARVKVDSTRQRDLSEIGPARAEHRDTMRQRLPSRDRRARSLPGGAQDPWHLPSGPPPAPAPSASRRVPATRAPGRPVWRGSVARVRAAEADQGPAIAVDGQFGAAIRRIRRRRLRIRATATLGTRRRNAHHADPSRRSG